ALDEPSLRLDEWRERDHAGVLAERQLEQAIALQLAHVRAVIDLAKQLLVRDLLERLAAVARPLQLRPVEPCETAPRARVIRHRIERTLVRRYRRVERADLQRVGHLDDVLGVPQVLLVLE